MVRQGDGLMSRLRPSDEIYHYQDNSHRWIAPPGVDQAMWDLTVQAHIQEHLKRMGGNGKVPEQRSASCRTGMTSMQKPPEFVPKVGQVLRRRSRGHALPPRPGSECGWETVRDDISQWYDGRLVWVEGYEPGTTTACRSRGLRSSVSTSLFKA